jgi:hypothetical protein
VLRLEALGERTLPSVTCASGDVIQLADNGSNPSGQVLSYFLPSVQPVVELANGITGLLPGVKVGVEAGPGNPSGQASSADPGIPSRGAPALFFVPADGPSAGLPVKVEEEMVGPGSATGQPGRSSGTDLVIQSRGADSLVFTMQERHGSATETVVSSDPTNRVFLALGPGSGPVPVLLGEHPAHVEAALIDVHTAEGDRVFFYDQKEEQKPEGGTPITLRGGEHHGLLEGERSLGERIAPGRPGELSSILGGEEHHVVLIVSVDTPVTTLVLGAAVDGTEQFDCTPLGLTGVEPLNEPDATAIQTTPESEQAPGVGLVQLEDNSLTIIPAFLSRATDRAEIAANQAAGEEGQFDRFVVGLEPASTADGERTVERLAQAPSAQGVARAEEGESGAAEGVWAEVAEWSIPLAEGAFVLGLWQARRLARNEDTRKTLGLPRRPSRE